MEDNQNIETNFENPLLTLDIEKEPEEGLYGQILEKSTFSRNRIYIMICWYLFS